MIIEPSVSQVLRGIIHEMSVSLKDGLDPVKSAQIDTIIGVLGSCAVRVDHQSHFIREEASAIMALAKEYESAGQANGAISDGIKAIDGAQDDAALYSAASETLSALSDIGADAGEGLTQKLFNLFEQRLNNETVIIGGGFEAAGRG